MPNIDFEKTDYDVSSYDASKFLREAIGDELSLNNPIRSDRGDDYDIVEDFSILNRTMDNSYLTNEKSTLPVLNNSILGSHTNSPNNSRLNNSSEMYRTLKDKLRNSFRRSRNYITNERRKISDFFDDRLKTSKSPNKHGNRMLTDDLEKYKSTYNDRTAEKIYQTFSSKLGSNEEITDKQLLTLINQISYQRAVRNQLSNAVSICRNTREFESSPELIEAERLLLVSSLKETSAKKELVRIDYENNGKVTNEGKCRGSVTINSIECTVKEIVVKDTVFNYFYICVCSYAAQIVSTQAIERNGNKIKFSNCQIHFSNLEPEYEINVDIYALRLRKNIRNYSHESRFHINKVRHSYI